MMFSAFQTFGKLGALASSVARAWSPLALWPAGASSPGLWIDPSYSASEFQDSAGTTALSTVGTVLDSSNPVGLILDRKGGLALGPELVVSLSAMNGTISGPTAPVLATCTTNGLYGVQASLAVANKTWKVVISWSGNTALRQINLDLANSYANSLGTTESGSQTLYLRPSANNTTFVYAVGGLVGESFILDNISVREIPGLHLSQSTSAARPVASGRKNLLIGTAPLSTQSVTVAAIPHTITFSGGGTVTASGAYTGALTSGQTFTPTAGTLTLTVSGSVTSAQLERGSAATSYQAVVSDSSYTATGFPQYLKFDGVDDALASATFSAGTLTSSMDCLIAVRRDSAANAVFGLYNAVADATKYFGMAESGSGSGCVGSGAGTPTVWVDGTQLTGGTAVTRGTLHTALTAGSYHILEFRNLDLSAWTATGFGLYTSYVFPGARGDIMLFESTASTEDKDAARQWLADYYGVTLP
jgi:hypothetical protein